MTVKPDPARDTPNQHLTPRAQAIAAGIPGGYAGTNRDGTGWAVRRLTPEECEALQGFPRDWTRIPYRNKTADKCPDGPRYKALGNSWAVNCGEWIFDRMREVDAIT